MTINLSPYLLVLVLLLSCKEPVSSIDRLTRPNIILVMADDLGWGDVAYNGNEIVQTPFLDEMASQGLSLNRFYAASPVCSPTRASCLTGKHPYRTNIPWAGDGYLLDKELTIAEALKTKGYATGHFGKWHVGGMSETVKQSYFPGPSTAYSPPWENGFDVAFSTESMMPTFNPYYHVGGAFGEEDYRHIQNVQIEHGQKHSGSRWRDYYWTGKGEFVDEWLEGDDAEIVMDQTLTFIKSVSEKNEPFLSVVWFHNVHTPVVAGEANREQYKSLSIEEQHWYGAITAMDKQIGRLRLELSKLGIAENTIIWFCSDNGPSYIHEYNSSGPFRGKKSELLEGGVCVPSIIEWPANFPEPLSINTPISTSDFFPTLLAITEIDYEQRVLDGEDVMPILLGAKNERNNPIGFRSPLPNRLRKQDVMSEEQFAWVDNRFKIISMDNGVSYQLYDITADPGEKQDLSNEFPEIKEQMIDELLNWSLTLD